MAINKSNKVEEKQEEEKVVYTVKVLKATPRKNKPNCYRFNALVNGITVYGMDYITYTGKNGDESTFIAFPQYQSSDGKYYNHVYFPVNDPMNTAIFEAIEKQIEALL